MAADQKLEELRRRFVEGANKAVITQLLDDLLEKKVFNEEEAEEVEAAARRQEQARTLIDHARRKGARASQAFIESLLRRDPCLAEQLGLAAAADDAAAAVPPAAAAQVILPLGSFRTPPTCPPPHPPGPRANRSGEDARQQPLEESRQGVKLCPPGLFQKIQAEEDGDIYPILDSKDRSRLALVVCNIHFSHLPKREGAEVDLLEMQRLLEGLGYQVDTEKDLCSQDMAGCLRRFAAREEHSTSDSTFVVLMSHGQRGALCGVDSQGEGSDLLSLDVVFSTFNNKNCPALRRKPKVIVIQACRGGNKGFAYVSDAASLHPAPGPPPEDLEPDAVQRVHVESDFLCLQSTTPDNRSWRHPQTGSIFITRLREHLQEHAWECHLEEVFRKVLQSFEKSPLQMPAKDRTTLSRKFYLFPGH